MLCLIVVGQEFSDSIVVKPVDFMRGFSYKNYSNSIKKSVLFERFLEDSQFYNRAFFVEESASNKDCLPLVREIELTFRKSQPTFTVFGAKTLSYIPYTAFSKIDLALNDQGKTSLAFKLNGFHDYSGIYPVVVNESDLATLPRESEADVKLIVGDWESRHMLEDAELKPYRNASLEFRKMFVDGVLSEDAPLTDLDWLDTTMGKRSTQQIPLNITAPIEPEFIDNLLVAKTRINKGLSSDDSDRLAQQGWSALKALTAIVSDIFEDRLQNASFSKLLDQYSKALGENYAEMDAIRAGIVGSMLNALAEVANEEMLPEKSKPFNEFCFRHAEFIRRFPDWQKYQTDSREPVIDLGALTAISSSLEVVVEKTESSSDLVHKDISDLLRSMLANFQRSLGKNYELAMGLLRSVRNVTARIAEHALSTINLLPAPFLNLLKDFSKETRSVALKMAAGGLLTASVALMLEVSGGLQNLARAVPSLFSWVESALRALGIWV